MGPSVIAKRAVALALAAAGALAICAAYAADGTEPIRVAVSAPAACMDAPRFFGQIQARTSRARPASDNEPARLFSVFLSLEPPGSRGTLVITGADGKSLVRDVPGSTCDEVASALALIAALAIDPNARTAPVAGATSSSAAPPPAPTPVKPPLPPCPSCPAGQPPTFVIMPSPTIQKPLQLDVGLGVEVLTGVAPSAAWAGSLWWDLYRDERWRMLRFTLVRTASASSQQRDGKVKFSLTAARVEACPIGIALGSSVSARGCARLEAGVLNADSNDASGLQAISRGWIGAGAIGALRWHPARAVGFEGHVGAAFPFVRDRFVWHDGRTVHHVPAAQLLGGIGMVVHFL
jgi:hypothetical protein